MWRKVRITRCIVLLVILLTCCCPGNSLLAETPSPFPSNVFTENNFTESDFLSIDDEMKDFLAAHVPKSAVAFFKQGNLSSARKYLKIAEEKALSPRDRLRYNQKLEYLYSRKNSD